MSFFSSLQQMVSSGVANLNLSPKRLSLSKESGTPASADPGNKTTASANNSDGRSASVPGFPRVVPPPGTPCRRKTIDQGPRRTGSFRGPPSPQPRQPLVFCRRRLSWPEVDQQATSGYVLSTYINFVFLYTLTNSY